MVKNENCEIKTFPIIGKEFFYYIPLDDKGNGYTIATAKVSLIYENKIQTISGFTYIIVTTENYRKLKLKKLLKNDI
jgi:hypothetical protein